MAAGAQARSWDKPSRRRVPRFGVHVPLDVTMLRSGIPDTVPGRSLNLCERGLAAVIAGEITPGDTVGVEVRLPLSPEPLRARALVRYQDKLRCGLEFVGLSAEQQAAIRTWAELSKTATEPEPAAAKSVSSAAGTAEDEKTEASAPGGSRADGSGAGGPGAGGPGSGGPGRPVRKRSRRVMWIVLSVVAAILAGVSWWRWNRGWEELESGLPNHSATNDNDNDAPVALTPEVQVPAEEMQKLLVHRVDPEYPAAARQEKLQAVIVLDVVVGRDGSVLQTRAMNGPEVLARAAMDAVRWWKFEPYQRQGKPAVVETTVAVEFKI
ncbi:MAG TPA: TonB family protein [Candidatus Sulfotelmatobacter sp.]|nr:TonB family protein [Candidatus Sulfotelmatobacter sp.]